MTLPLIAKATQLTKAADFLKELIVIMATDKRGDWFIDLAELVGEADEWMIAEGLKKMGEEEE